jgi:hypothetical protein
MKAIKAMIGGMIGETGLGMLDYYRFPAERESWGGSFNGQMRRVALFEAIMQAMRPAAIIETGTFRGTTTRHLALAGVPVYTIEQDARNLGFAKAQLRGHPNVTLIQRDSRLGLREILGGALRAQWSEAIFCYLDAHWQDDLPLRGELEIIFDALERPIVMIDDFEVPGDAGYGYDDYGSTGALTQSYIEPILRGRDVTIMYPSAPSDTESGARRGCCVLSRRADAAVLLETGLLCEAHLSKPLQPKPPCSPTRARHC